MTGTEEYPEAKKLTQELDRKAELECTNGQD